MKYANRGETLIEVLIYAFLLSFLLAGFVRYAYATHLQDIQLMHDIEDAQNK